MPSIRPFSDLQNYNELLRNVAIREPVILTKNGKEKYVILDIADYEKMQATMKLITELAKGEKSEREQGWLSSKDVERSLLI